MDYGTLQGLITLTLIIIFIGIFAWAYSARRKTQFDEAANLIFDDESQVSKNSGEQKQC